MRLADGRVWLRVARPSWPDPLDPSHAGRRGGRWNPPNSFPTLYLNADLATAKLQVVRMLEGYPVDIYDLDDDAYVLVAATVPRNQTCADAVRGAGLRALGLPPSYPLDEAGNPLPRTVCQGVGALVHAGEGRGVIGRSATTADGRGRELAWFPARSRSRAKPFWPEPRPLGDWRDAVGWADLDIPAPDEPLS